MEISRWWSAAAYYAAQREAPDQRRTRNAPRMGRGKTVAPVSAAPSGADVPPCLVPVVFARCARSTVVTQFE